MKYRIPIPRFHGVEADLFEIDPAEPAAVLIAIGDDKGLLVLWDVDDTGAGRFRIRMMGYEDGKPIRKQYVRGASTPAFFGEVAVVGPGSSEIFASMGYEDADVLDHEGNVTNKPREVCIIPKQDY